MKKTFDIVNIVIMTSLFMFLALNVWIGYEESAWKQRCKDAGGVPAKFMVCINPGAVIEVD